MYQGRIRVTCYRLPLSTMQAFRRRSDVKFGFQKPSVRNFPAFAKVSKDGVMVCPIQKNIVPLRSLCKKPLV